MPGLPVLSAREVLNALRRLGFELHHQTGSHVVMKHAEDPTRRAVVPMHPDLRKGTLNSILKGAKVSHEEFLEAVR
ncbi:MAG TPA: type II toxin-antitoxin system HicA family toxin [Thermoplasmata archaeon]|nr:type II toxin-antitoxin system HicA family toxin [Thermoplasmata archaeon]